MAKTYFGQYKVDTHFIKRIAKKLKEVRLSKGLTVEKLSENSTLNPVTIFRIESGKKNFTISSFRDICRGLGVKPRTFDDLFD